METDADYDFPGANLKTMVECGHCRRKRKASASSRYRRVNRTNGDYYYLDQRHEHHEGQRTTVPVWLLHRLVERVMYETHNDLPTILKERSRRESYPVAYPRQDLLEELLEQRIEAADRLNEQEIHRLDKDIELELQRQREEYRVTFRIFGDALGDLRDGFILPKTDEAFERLAQDMIPMITIEKNKISIWSVFGIVHTYVIPDKPEWNDVLAEHPNWKTNILGKVVEEHERRSSDRQHGISISLPAEYLFGAHLA